MKNFTPAALAAAAVGDLDNLFVAATPGGIEAQEKAGQTTFVANATLPKDMRSCARADFEKLGFTFGNDVDDLFVTSTLPEGWKKAATDHSMWSDLLDGKGRKRASIFYKAAFYDRSASIHLANRYGTDHYKPVDSAGRDVEYGQHTHFAVIATDCGEEIHRVGIYPKEDYKASNVLEVEALAWLDEMYPQHRDQLAYWD